MRDTSLRRSSVATAPTCTQTEGPRRDVFRAEVSFFMRDSRVAHVHEAWLWPWLWIPIPTVFWPNSLRIILEIPKKLEFLLIFVNFHFWAISRVLCVMANHFQFKSSSLIWYSPRPAVGWAGLSRRPDGRGFLIGFEMKTMCFEPDPTCLARRKRLFIHSPAWPRPV
jgi:hypothetical protein